MWYALLTTLCTFYCGWSHYFISTRCVEIFSFKVITLPSLMVVTTFIDSNVETNWVCENCLIIVKKGTFLISLIYLPFKKIYVVLGTDWLSPIQCTLITRRKSFSYPQIQQCNRRNSYTLGRYYSYWSLSFWSKQILYPDTYRGCPHGR